jgi:hypothetical protein
VSLSDISTDVLRQTFADLDHQIAALRERKLAISRELETRFPDEEPQDRPAAQIATPGFVESDAGVFSPAGPPLLPDVPEPRRRWWRA